MGKYDSVLGDLRNQFANAKQALVVLPAEVNTDKLAAGLALFLSLHNTGKEVSIVTQSTPTVSNTNLYGVGQISNSIPKTGAGNLTITLEGVVASDGTVPSLEKLDWYPQGANLNLIFHVIPGTQFQPARIIPSYQGGVDLIFTIGAATLDNLGSIYQNNRDIFTNNVVNIDNNPSNTQYGGVNVVDTQAATLSEMVTQVIQGLGLNTDADTASNILTGIYESTANLTQNVKPDTFIAVAAAMQAGGRVPAAPMPQAPLPQMSQPAQPVSQPAESLTPTQAYNQGGFPPLNQVFGFPVTPEAAPEPVQSQPQTQQYQSGSPEEKPMGEYVGSSNPEVPATPEPDWLTPKIYKGVH